MHPTKLYTIYFPKELSAYGYYTGTGSVGKYLGPFRGELYY